MYLLTSACYLFSDAPNPFRLFVLGPVCWNLSLCAQTASNKCNGVASNSCVHMDEKFYLLIRYALLFGVL